MEILFWDQTLDEIRRRGFRRRARKAVLAEEEDWKITTKKTIPTKISQDIRCCEWCHPRSQRKLGFGKS
ncbi:hypothetical protein U1Q18_006033 [Sarracenia purpurea var. burkii]